VNQRDQVAMTDQEAAAFLAAGRKAQLATNGSDGFPHLVTIYYGLTDGQITFWTYRKSQKALNLERDPRISCLVEDGAEYFDLRGVLVQGTATRVDDPREVAAIGRRISAVIGGAMASAGEEALAAYVEHAARKRCGYRVEPANLISWDHTKLGSG
jgi:PPOX class probable F420-dependent enzyme